MLKFAIVGAGLSGIAAARVLRQRAVAVTLFDRGRNIGGRCATRCGEYSYDYGAPFFTVSNNDFAREVSSLEEAGVVKRWNCRAAEIANHKTRDLPGEERYVGAPTMSAMPEFLSRNLDILQSCEITKLEKCAYGWRLINADGAELGDYSTVILAMPPEQARKLLPPASSIFPQIVLSNSVARWNLMVSFKHRLPIDLDVLHVTGSPIERLVKQSIKPSEAAVDSWVIQSSAEWAEARVKYDSTQVVGELLTALAVVIGEQIPSVAHSRAHRWRLALPSARSDRDAIWDDELLIAVCGDWCVAPNIEGAFLSGMACGELVFHALSKESI